MTLCQRSFGNLFTLRHLPPGVVSDGILNVHSKYYLVFLVELIQNIQCELYVEVGEGSK